MRAADREDGAGGGSAGSGREGLHRSDGAGEIVLSARDIAAGYERYEVFRGVSLDLPGGSLTALVGPNGSGKTTLLHCACGLHPLSAGEVTLEGIPLGQRSRRDIARRLALVAQFAEVDVNLTVEETVALGRYPHIGPIGAFSESDNAAVQRALAEMDLEGLRSRPLQTLSGGERQRVHLARALAQQTRILLLDEPVASLDLHYQQDTYGRLRELAHRRGLAVLVADHHLNLVAATCDRVLVLHQGGIVASGSPREIITEEMIGRVFGARMVVQPDEEGRPQCQWVF